MNEEKIIKPNSGYLMLLLFFVLLAFSVASIVMGNFAAIGTIIIAIFILPGFMVINPNQSRVLTLFGKYKGTVKQDGFYWVNPFYTKRKISLRARNLDSDRIKVNDSLGNPIVISVVVVWKVQDTAKAAFEVDDFARYVSIQSDGAVRDLAGTYPYDNFEDADAEITLRSGGNKVNELLENQLNERLTLAGIEIIEARINHLAYAEEIASAMLQRQQATAIVAARFKIVEGAVSMVQLALDQLSEQKVVDFDEEKKATMISNLMVVLCGDKAAQPVVNTGTLYQ